MHEFFRGRIAYFDRRVADFQHEHRRDTLDVSKRSDEVEASMQRATHTVQSLTKQVDNIHRDVLETPRSERQVADVRHSSHEELTKSKLNDMPGCIQDRVEDRLSELHKFVHTQVEEVHVRVDEFDNGFRCASDRLCQAEERAARFGVVLSSCLATSRTLTSRMDQLDKDIQRERSVSPAPPGSDAHPRSEASGCLSIAKKVKEPA